MAKLKKAQSGKSVDSTGYHSERVKKAMSLFDKAKSEKLGTDYEKNYSSHLDRTVKDKLDYEKRKLNPAGPATSGLKKGGKVSKQPCAKCGKTIKK